VGRTFVHWVVGIASFLLAGELALRALPVSTSTETGYYIDPLIITYPPYHSWTNATGWDLRNVQHNRSNNVGFLADHDFERDPTAVALIGDSYVEASMLPRADRIGAQLERALDGRPVFVLGGPGSALLDYAERIRFASERYGIRDFVVLVERGDLWQSFCGSGNIHGPCLDRQTLAPRTELQPPPGLAKQILRHSALAQYLFGQLKLNPRQLWRQAVAQARPATPAAPEVRSRTPGSSVAASDMSESEVDAVTHAFFERVRTRIPGRLVIVVDGDRKAIYRGQPTNDSARLRFIEHARAAGAMVVDADPLFRTQFETSPMKFDVGPYDAHLNTLGVAVVARAVSELLR
jgi:hypothetical protein